MDPESSAERTPPTPTTEGRVEAETPTKLQTEGIILSPSLDEPGWGFMGSEARAQKETTESACESPLTANKWSVE